MGLTCKAEALLCDRGSTYLQARKALSIATLVITVVCFVKSTKVAILSCPLLTFTVQEQNFCGASTPRILWSRALRILHMVNRLFDHRIRRRITFALLTFRRAYLIFRTIIARGKTHFLSLCNPQMSHNHNVCSSNYTFYKKPFSVIAH